MDDGGVDVDTHSVDGAADDGTRRLVVARQLDDARFKAELGMQMDVYAFWLLKRASTVQRRSAIMQVDLTDVAFMGEAVMDGKISLFEHQRKPKRSKGGKQLSSSI